MGNPKLDLTQEQALALLNRWRGTVSDYMSEVLHIQKIWKLQDALLRAVPRAIAERKPIYVGSGHSLGKDYITAAISLWFLDCYEPSIVIQTAPTDRQVKKIMWGETKRHWNNRPKEYGGNAYTNPYIEMRREDWYLIGFTTKESGSSADSGGGKFQGFHSPNICVIVTEAQAIEDVIFDQIDGVTTSENILTIFIGNPTRAKGRFAKGLRDKKNNIVFNFSCLENPNYLHQQTIIPGLASYEWVEDKRRRWGEDDPRWIGRVLGQIPDSGVSHVLGQRDIDLMKKRQGFLSIYSDNAGVAVDSAGEGTDDNVIMGGKGGEVLKKIIKANMAPSEQAMEAVAMCKELHGSFVVFDCDGIGIGAYQEACKLPKDYIGNIQLIKFHGSKTFPITEREEAGENYHNLRVKAAFITQARARRGQAAIDENDTELIEDLMEEEYFEKGGTIRLEEKEDIKERLQRSPGRGDCFKMLQWGFEQNFERVLYKPNDQRLPRTAMPDNTDLRTIITPDVRITSLPRTAAPSVTPI